MMTNSRTFLLTFAMLFVVSGASGAQGVLIDRSEIRFVSKQMGVKVEGRFPKWKANIVFVPGSPSASKAEFEIDLAGVDLASSDSEAEVRSPAWFDTARFAVARFVSTSINDRGGGRYDVVGKLSMKGITRDCVVSISFTNDATGNRVAEGNFVVKRLDFKIGEGLWADTDTVANEVNVAIRMVLPPLK